MMKRFSCAGAFGTKTGSGLPSQAVMERNDHSAKVVRLREAGYRFEAQLRELERQFDAKARELSEKFLSAVDELNGEE
jgi:tRNA U34 5-methylaminomethyl-2-thiouridine-forming methyltransferase MnmC